MDEWRGEEGMDKYSSGQLFMNKVNVQTYNKAIT